MANFSQRTDGPRLALPTGVEVSSYATYLEAQRAVDHLSDEDFPVQDVSIVGTDLRMVEKVLGRLTYGRVALAGAMNGAWFGLLIGLLFLWMVPAGSGMIFAAPLLGAAFGILAGIVGFALRSRDRDFTSTSQVVASRYAIIAGHEVAGRARRELEQAGLAGHTRPVAQAPHAAQQAQQAHPVHPTQPTQNVQHPTAGDAAVPPPGGPYGGVGGSTQAPYPQAQQTQDPTPQGPPRYGIRLEPGQSVEDVTGRPPSASPGQGADSDSGRPGPEDRA